MVSMFTEEGGPELPYPTEFGYPERFAGAEGITGFTEFLHDTSPGVHQLFFARLVVENGKIKLVREGMNSAEVARAVFTQGIPESPPRTDD
jgi:hypothetical protein